MTEILTKIDEIRKARFKTIREFRGKKICYLCGQGLNKNNKTNDHVIPDCLFPDPKPSDLLTLPCCKSCQEKYRKDEEYFRNHISAIVDVKTNKKALQVWQATLRSLKYSKGMAKEIRAGLSEVQLKTPQGIYLGNATTINIDSQRIKSVFYKIVFGLYVAHTGRRMKNNVEFSVYFDPANRALFDIFNDLLKKPEFLYWYKETFSYMGKCAVDSEACVWALNFYRSAVVYIIFEDTNFV